MCSVGFTLAVCGDPRRTREAHMWLLDGFCQPAWQWKKHCRRLPLQNSHFLGIFWNTDFLIQGACFGTFCFQPIWCVLVFDVSSAYPKEPWIERDESLGIYALTTNEQLAKNCNVRNTCGHVDLVESSPSTSFTVYIRPHNLFFRWGRYAAVGLCKTLPPETHGNTSIAILPECWTLGRAIQRGKIPRGILFPCTGCEWIHFSVKINMKNMFCPAIFCLLQINLSWNRINLTSSYKIYRSSPKKSVGLVYIYLQFSWIFYGFHVGKICSIQIDPMASPPEHLKVLMAVPSASRPQRGFSPTHLKNIAY